MNANSEVGLSERRNAVLSIVIGGLSAGILDLTQALILFGTRVPLGIAAGLLGRQAAHRGGLAIMFSAFPAFLHRVLSSDCLLRREPRAEVFNRALIHLRIDLWRDCRSSDDANRSAALRASRPQTE